MEAHKITLIIIDHDQLGADGVKDEIENVNYPNDCISPHVISIETVDIGEWRDEHPLNCRDTFAAEINRLFPGFFDVTSVTPK